MTEAIEFIDEPVEVPARKIELKLAVWIVGFGVIALIIGLALLDRNRTQPTSGAAPDFSYTTFNGEPFHLIEQRGKIVVLNFWASWCDPCRDEAPVLATVWEQYRDRGVVVVGIAYADVERDSLAFIEEFGISYPNGPDIGTNITRLYRIQGVPETFVIDRDGSVVELIIGPVAEGQLETIFASILD